MPSIVPGFEYDIFLSYRHNDNRSGWVTGFVESLKKELAATIKEPVSIYFDESPHDGLQETHYVDDSLKEKLKCTIFIPIISQTYCDPTSFAWKNEFLSFKKLVNEDRFGLKVKLAGGNVASRILPVRIHDLDATDKALIESEIGPLRAIDFIFKSSGVNRPLSESEDHPNDNLNKTYYRDQVNKVALSIKEIISALKNPVTTTSVVKTFAGVNERVQSPEGGPKSVTPNSKKWLIPFLIIGVLVAALIYYFQFQSKPDVTITEKSIAVAPFVNLSNDPDQEYISDAMMQAILSHLSKIDGLRLTSSTTMMTYKGTKKRTPEIANEVGVRYVLEGSVQRVDNTIRINARLVDGETDRPIWSEDYDRKITDLLSIQSEVAQQIASKLEVKIKPATKIIIEAIPTKNAEAYDLYLRAIHYGSRLTFNSLEVDSSKQYRSMLEKAIVLDPQFASPYTELGWILLTENSLTPKEIVQKAEPLFNKALSLNPNNIKAHSGLGALNLWYKWDFYSAQREYNYAAQLEPSNPFALSSDIALAMGKFSDAVNITSQHVKAEPNNLIWKVEMALALSFNSKFNEAERYLDSVSKSSGHLLLYGYGDIGRVHLYGGQYAKAVEAIETANKKGFVASRLTGVQAIALIKLGKMERATQLLEELKNTKSHYHSPYFYTAMVYTQLGEFDHAFHYLEQAFSAHEVDMFWLKVEPSFKPLHNDRRWQVMLDKVGFPEY